MPDHDKPLVGTNILVVDDDKNSLRLLVDFFQAKGAMISYENNGIDAMRRVESDIFDLAILDLRLPEENGFVVTEYIKKKAALPIPVIIVTAFADKQNRLRAFEAGADAFFSKPVDLQELLLVTANLARHSCLRQRFAMLEQLNAVMEKSRNLEGHGKRVEEISLALADSFKISGNDLLLLRQAALLHDLGKIGEAEGRPHWDVGAEIISATGYLEKVALLVRHHHDFPEAPDVPSRLQKLIKILQLAERAAEAYEHSPEAIQNDIHRGLIPQELADCILSVKHLFT
ncbi:MAG: response regulator [Thermacetogeniaceae bacterium]